MERLISAEREVVKRMKGYAHKVDGKIVKEDTYYALKNGKFVEVKNDEN